jgi:histidinol-phosphate aminotransferase
MPLALVIGGTRSGKSEIAERLVSESGLPVTYLATGSASDDEMAERIAVHRARRPAAWSTAETLAPETALADAGGRAVLLDSLGTWVAALIDDPEVIGRVERFAAVAARRPEPTVVVADEAGLGVVPANALARRFANLTGEAAQMLSAASDQVLLVVAGRALELAPARASEAAPELRYHGDAVAREVPHDHAVSVVEEPRPAWLEEALEHGLRASSAYPDDRAAREAIARRHGREPDEVVLTNGGNESFWLLASALRPRHAVCVHPSYTEPEAALRAHGTQVERVFRRQGDFALDPDAVPPGADLVVTGNPNNPSGNLDPAKTLERLARPGRTLVVDEAFMDFVAGEPESLAGGRDLDGLVVVRSLTKLWSLPGVRAGYLLAPPRLVRALERVRPSWSVNSLALEALRACAARPAEGDERARRIAGAREMLVRGLGRARAIETWPSVANFILARAREGRGEAVRSALLDRGIGVRPCASFPGLGADHFRVAVRNQDANTRLVEALAEVAP